MKNWRVRIQAGLRQMILYVSQPPQWVQFFRFCIVFLICHFAVLILSKHIMYWRLVPLDP